MSRPRHYAAAAELKRADLPDVKEMVGDELDYGDDDGFDEPHCDRCHGQETDPMCDHLLPCPACQGEQR